MNEAPAPREWFSAAELAEMALPGIPTSDRGVMLMAERCEWLAPTAEGSGWRRREGRGGGVEFHHSVLPRRAQQPILQALARMQDKKVIEAARLESRRQEMWAWWERQPDTKKNVGIERMQWLDTVRAAVARGQTKTDAMIYTAAAAKVAVSTLYAWENMVAGIDRCDWMVFLTPRHVGRTASAECDPMAWDFIKADYLRPEQPNFSSCYTRLKKTAAVEGWKIPSEDTLKRRIDKLPAALRVRERKGTDALKVMYPAQQRDRSVFHALQAVNADGHKWDVFVRWPDGYVGRPLMVAFQDLYSGKFLSWRVDRSENREAVRLAFGDMLEDFGIPEICYLDNGRSFASKWLTGGISNRFRFKVKEDDPAGIMTQLGVEVHWTTPYSGQSKPIERGFRDFAQEIAKHPAFAGAWTGNTVADKPSNYDAKNAVPIELFLKTIGGAIAEHNARGGRRTAIAAGRSFDEVFAASYANSMIRKATDEQRRLWLMAAEAVRASSRDGSIELLGNRYWDEKLNELRGQKLVVRFDPERLQEPLHIYTLAGLYVVSAACVAAVGFNDVEAARDHARRRNTYLRGVKLMAEAEKRMSIQQVAAMLPQPAEEIAPETKIVRPMFGRAMEGSAALKVAEEDDALEAMFASAMADRRAQRGEHIRLVEETDGD